MNALADPRVGEFLNKHFVSSFQKVATFQIVNGQKQGGNVASYFCAPDGRVLHCVAGPVDGAQLLREANWVVDTVRWAWDEHKKSEVPFKVLFRRRHAERLRTEHGLVVEAVTFDPPEPGEEGALTAKDPTGRPLAPVLPPPPIDGPDVTMRPQAAGGEDAAEGLKAARDRRGNCWRISTSGRVHQLLSAYSMVKIERLYGTVFENILGEKISTKPVVTVGATPGCRTAVCLRCGSRPHRE